MTFIFSTLAGFFAGVLSGFGIGGGTLLMLFLTLVSGMDQRQAAGINLVYFIFCALPALWGHWKNGYLQKKPSLLAIAAGLPACIIAAVLASVLDVTLLRRCFGFFLLFVGFRELFSDNGKKTSDK